jgi:hypothetical protein
MSIANLHFSRILIHLSHPLYICKHNLQAAMDKEDCGLIAVTTIKKNCGLRIPNIQFRQLIDLLLNMKEDSRYNELLVIKARTAVYTLYFTEPNMF